jgi:nudix-type nucleoside diphosphatase (YffH/AdpP family)
VNDRIRIVDEKLLSRNWGTLSSLTFEVEERNGSWRRHTREVYDRGNAACILLYNAETGTILLVRQLRIPVIKADPSDDPWLIEACAGLLDGDTPEACARKEAEEETGCRPRHVRHLFDVHMSPGSVTEKLSFFLGEYRPEDRVSAGGGLAHEGEDIEVLELKFGEALAMAADGRIRDAKTILLLQALALSGEMQGLAVAYSPARKPTLRAPLGVR